MVPSSATNQRSPIPAGAWRCRKSQHSRNWQRRRLARGTVRVTRWCKYKCFALQLLCRRGQVCDKCPKCFFSPHSLQCETGTMRETHSQCSFSFILQKRGCSAVSIDGADEYAWNINSWHTTVCQPRRCCDTLTQTHAWAHALLQYWKSAERPCQGSLLVVFVCSLSESHLDVELFAVPFLSAEAKCSACSGCELN